MGHGIAWHGLTYRLPKEPALKSLGTCLERYKLRRSVLRTNGIKRQHGKSQHYADPNPAKLVGTINEFGVD
ncbi:predicted protein [Sclerotinia sclerotiorum 1980 UF-70]|uniref:Uncharacterized protein n=1 Tax=Sclerotinia sclerotiorum (strain ATCC 18683 / 1980 / Ss-1) TaxID=665079 RepID=A7F5V4_SCLS1|nr:predicted protein [Sclerotinia sclerotiorum 1980 UF-70]EDN98125.1 predicted protein [Sclerotinia sclerotiorum 1980 UF-70]